MKQPVPLLTPVHQAFSAYLAIGALGLLVNTFALMLLHEQFALPLWAASLLAGEIALLHNYGAHSGWTLRNTRPERWQWLHFQLLALPVIGLATLLLLWFSRVGMLYPLANLLAGLIASLTGYFLLIRRSRLSRAVNPPSEPGGALVFAIRRLAIWLILLGVFVSLAWMIQISLQAEPLQTTTLLVYGLIVTISLILSLQAVFTLYLMLYTWIQPERLQASASPPDFAPPQLSFTVLLPARHEEAVIAQTVQRVWAADYPRELLEVVVVCEHNDHGTISEAQRAIDAIGSPNLRVITFDDEPINKPHGLNVALRATQHQVVTIFDAEDDVHSDIFQIANTVMLQHNAGILQAGVQLMNAQSNWFAVHNVLEYFFWFKSRLHFHAMVQAVPLGGNTVFMRRDLLESVGGWDERCLTEDADLGMRLSALGVRTVITYDAEHVTREETPPTVSSFIKQRTRWNQGFLQVLRKGDWLQLPRVEQRSLAAYTLTFPFLQAFVGLLWLPALVMMFFVKMPVTLAMISLLPLYALALQCVVNLVGLFEFAGVYGIRLRLRDIVVFLIGFLPYQILLSLGAIRAVYREGRGMNNWEKTEHSGVHRHGSGAMAGD
jgi:cellulose synthase/poly-beta-1,6-N-acetylglucosamine synthase-like glycosyltransferase/putative flippase GtrA